MKSAWIFQFILFLWIASSSSQAQSLIAANNSAMFVTPENWIQDANGLRTNCPGAYVKFAFTGTSLNVVIDSSAYAQRTPGVNHELPKLGIVLDGNPLRTLIVPQIGSAVTVNLANGLSNGTHQIKLSLDGLGKDERWNSPIDQLKIKNFALDNGASITRPQLLNKRVVVYGDSITEGADALGRENIVADKQWSTTWDSLLATKLNAEVSAIAFQAQGYHNAGQGNVPPFPQSYTLIQAGVARHFSQPDYVMVLQGTNGGASSSEVSGMMMNLRRSYPSAKIIFAVPFGGYARDAITSAYQSLQNRDSSLYLLDLGQSGEDFVASNSNDGIHPTVAGHSGLADMLYQQILDQVPAF